MYSTSSQTGTSYFAYGSNLSPEQMAYRCDSSPESSQPIAIARLDGWEWFICDRGYANVAPSQSGPRSLSRSPSRPTPKSIPSQSSQVARPQPPPSAGAGAAETRADVVWGIVYNLKSADEETLDGFEGHSSYRNPSPTPNPSPDPKQVRRKPLLQNGWDYNKIYLPVKITKWLRDPRPYGLTPSTDDQTTVTALVYVDENSTREGDAGSNYVRRMNRAIKQSTALGVPKEWVENVMRRSIPEGPMPEDVGESRAGGGFGPGQRGGGRGGGAAGVTALENEADC